MAVDVHYGAGEAGVSRLNAVHHRRGHRWRGDAQAEVRNGEAGRQPGVGNVACGGDSENGDGDRRGGHAEDDCPFWAETLAEPREGEVSDDEDDHHRKELEASCERVRSHTPLEEDGDEEHSSEQADVHEYADDVAQGEITVPHYSAGVDLSRAAALPPDEAHESERCCGKTRDGHRGAPSSLWALHECHCEASDRNGEQQVAEHRNPTALGGNVRQDRQGHPNCDDPDWQVDPEDPSPPEPGDDEAADHWPKRRGRSAHRCPEPDHALAHCRIWIGGP